MTETILSPLDEDMRASLKDMIFWAQRVKETSANGNKSRMADINKAILALANWERYHVR